MEKHIKFIMNNISEENFTSRDELIDLLDGSNSKYDYIYRMFREMYTAYLLHLDFVVAKTIPAFMDTLLMTLLAGKKIRYKEEYNKVRREIEDLNRKALIQECYDLGLLSDEERDLFSSVDDNNNPLNRNYEYHTKDYTKIKKKSIMIGDKVADDFEKSIFTENPNFRYDMNYQAISKMLREYIVRLYNFMVLRSKDLHKEELIPDKKVFDVLGSDFDIEKVIKHE